MKALIRFITAKWIDFLGLFHLLSSFLSYLVFEIWFWESTRLAMWVLSYLGILFVLIWVIKLIVERKLNSIQILSIVYYLIFFVAVYQSDSCFQC